MKLLLPLLLLSTLSAQAAEEKKKLLIPCQIGESLEKDGQDCESNSVFSKAGEACVSSVEKTIKGKSGEVALALAASNLAHTGDGNNAQSSNFTGAAADYAISLAALQDLIRAAKVVRVKVADLPNHIYYPEDFDAPEEVIGNPVEFLDSQDCYNDARTSLERSLKKIDKQIADLEKSYKAAAARGNVSSGRASDTTSLNNAAGEKDGKNTAPTLPNYKGEDKKRQSDISGTKEAEEKKKK